MGKFLDSLKDREVFVDENPEYDKLVAITPQDRVKSCLICGKPFKISDKGRGKYCPR